MAGAGAWEEIKRLAADFQKAQLSCTAQRLSERNCVEIVTKLVELKLIDVIFTTDGKEYLTPAQLTREIRDEVLVRGGRVNIVELAKELNVDLSQINASVAEIVRSKDVQLVSGHLLSHLYLDKIAREINEKLQQQGQVSVGELTLQYELPGDLLLHNVIEKNLGKIIIGKQDTSDPRIFYTEQFITRSKAMIRGALLGLLKPTPVAVIVNQCSLTDRLFMSLFDQLSAPGSLTGRQAGASYVPACYTRSQTDWVRSFYRQNNYMEYDALSRLGISDPKGFVKKVLPNERLLFLKSCVVGTHIQETIESALEECVVSKGYVDVVTLLPSVLSDCDIEMLLDVLLKSNSKSVTLFHNTVISTQYLERLAELCRPTVLKRAEEAIKSGEYQQSCLEKRLGVSRDLRGDRHTDHKAERREERRRKAGGGKAGGGTQGRETKTKAVKKHPRSSRAKEDSDSDEASAAQNGRAPGMLELVSPADIEEGLRETLESEGLDDLVSTLATHLHSKLNQSALNIAKEAAEKLLQDASQSRKQTHSASQDIVNALMNDIRLYEKGLKLLPADTQPHFLKYLMKTLGGEVVAELCKYAASQCNVNVTQDTLTPEQRNKIIGELSAELKEPLRALNATLAEAAMEPFLLAMDTALAECGMILKKVDKKKDRVMVSAHRERLLQELEPCDAPEVVLHLTVLALYTCATHSMLHASGRLLPHVLHYLLQDTRLPAHHHAALLNYHELVGKLLTTTDENAREDVRRQLQEETSNVKKMPHDIKKQ